MVTMAKYLVNENEIYNLDQVAKIYIKHIDPENYRGYVKPTEGERTYPWRVMIKLVTEYPELLNMFKTESECREFFDKICEFIADTNDKQAFNTNVERVGL